MPGKAIPKNASLAFLVESGRLRDPDKYLSGVLNNMILCKREHGSAVVRIGTTGGATILITGLNPRVANSKRNRTCSPK